MFPLIFFALCAQKFWRERTFSGYSPRVLCSEFKALFVSEIKWRPKKRGLHPKSSSVRVRKVFCMIYYCNLMLNNNMSEQEHVCAQQIYAYAQSLKSVCARTT